MQLYDVRLKIRGRSSGKTKHIRPSYVQLLGERSRICAAYAALYEFVKPEARQSSLPSPHDLVGIESLASIEDTEARGIPEIEQPEFNSQTAPSAMEDLSTTLQAIASSETAQHYQREEEASVQRAHAGNAILAGGHQNANLTEDEDVRVLADLLDGVEAEYKFKAACQLALERLKAAFLQAPHDFTFIYTYICLYKSSRTLCLCLQVWLDLTCYNIARLWTSCATKK